MTESRNEATPEGAESPPGGAGSDAYVDRLGERLGKGVPGRETSDVQIRSPDDEPDDPALDVPPMPGPNDSVEAFADFEDEIEGENTRIDDRELLAEQSTAIIDILPRHPFLLVERGNDKGREFALQEGENGIGRGIDNDVILADVSVSRRHLRIHRDGDILTMKDLGSGNGTQVNGQRVKQQVLADGDRIEAGETTMVVRLPTALLAAADPYDTSAHTNENQVDEPILPPATPDPFQVPMMPGYSPELTPSATASARRGVTLSKTIFLVVIAAIVMVLALLGLLVTVLIVKTREPEEPVHTVTLADDPGPFSRGERAFEARRWEEAERAFNDALQQATPDPRAEDYLRRTRTAREHETTLSAGRVALNAGDGNLALQHASSIPADSPYAADAAEVAAHARAQLVAHHVGAGRAAMVRGDRDAALAELGQARNYGPNSEAVTSLARDLGVDVTAVSPSSSDDRERPTGTEPSSQQAVAQRDVEDDPGGRRVRRNAENPQREVIAAYLAGRFDSASQLARTSAGRERGEDRARLEALAGRIDRFAPLWQRIEAANFNASVRAQMEQAMALDRQIASNPQYRDRLKGPVVAAYVADARRARGNPATSCRAVRSALAIDPSNGPATQMGRECEANARGMLREGQSAPPDRAIAIARQVMLMVPSSSPAYAEARALFDRHRRRAGVDEDE